MIYNYKINFIMLKNIGIIDMKQKTIKNEIAFSGIGLHSGVNVNIKIKPAQENVGIVFRRIDIKEHDNEVKALYKNVVNTQLGTTIANQYGVVVQTIEHFMSAMWACEIDNAIIEIDNQETPIMDGSAEIFIKEIKKAGIIEQQKERKILQILKEVEFKEKNSSIKIVPYDKYKINLSVEYTYGNIGKQSLIFDGSGDYFIHEIAKARTFCNEREIEFMRQNGLALGGSLDNAMVFNDKTIINKDGFRCENEVVKHKLLDCIGDMYTSGYFIQGEIIADKTGHTLNNELLKKIFSDKDNYVIK